MDSMFMEFVNTRYYAGNDSRRDPLDDAEWMRKFVDRWHLPDLLPLNARQIGELSTLRALLSRAVAGLAGRKGLEHDLLGKLNDYLQATSLHYTLEPRQSGVAAVLKPVLSGTGGISRAIVLSFAEFLAEYDLERLRECQNPDCRWVFYDETKNASRKWCGNTCASLVKVRRFREKRRDEQKK